MTKENAKDFEFISSKVNDHENGKLSRVDLIFDLMKYTEQLSINVVISRLKERLEINAGRLAEPLLKEGKHPKDDKDCHKAFLMLAHLAEIEDYLNGL